MSSGFELLVIEMIGVMWSNWRMSDVADTPSRRGITMSCTPVSNLFSATTHGNAP